MATTDKAKQGRDLLLAVETLNRDKGIPYETVYTAIERAVRLALSKHFGEEEDVEVRIDRQRGHITARHKEREIDPTSGELGRIAAQAAKQQMIQMFREEESNNLMGDMSKMKGMLLTVPGVVQRMEGGAAIVQIGKHEAILPRGEMIPGEIAHPGEKIKALVKDVKRTGHRVKVILSRADELFVQRLFEREIPEIEDKTIKIVRVAREAGYRTKVAVSSIDNRVDCVGACVGVRGSRIKNITEELGGSERIDIVRWNDSVELLIQNALQPAEIEEVFLYHLLHRAIVLVREDQLSLAIGKRGQNVRLASKLVDWDIEIMTEDELNAAIEKAETQFSAIPDITPELINSLIENGCLSYEDLEPLTVQEVMQMTGVEEEMADEMIIFSAEQLENAERQGSGGNRRESTPTRMAPVVPTKAEQFDSLFKPVEEAPIEGEPVPEGTPEGIEGTEPIDGTELAAGDQSVEDTEAVDGELPPLEQEETAPATEAAAPNELDPESSQA
jgi:N utilization substance protein A